MAVIGKKRKEEVLDEIIKIEIQSGGRCVQGTVELEHCWNRLVRCGLLGGHSRQDKMCNRCSGVSDN